jgi:hypothetical protein
VRERVLPPQPHGSNSCFSRMHCGRETALTQSEYQKCISPTTSKWKSASDYRFRRPVFADLSPAKRILSRLRRAWRGVLTHPCTDHWGVELFQDLGRKQRGGDACPLRHASRPILQNRAQTCASCRRPKNEGIVSVGARGQRGQRSRQASLSVCHPPLSGQALLRCSRLRPFGVLTVVSGVLL